MSRNVGNVMLIVGTVLFGLGVVSGGVGVISFSQLVLPEDLAEAQPYLTDRAGTSIRPTSRMMGCMQGRISFSTRHGWIRMRMGSMMLAAT